MAIVNTSYYPTNFLNSNYYYDTLSYQNVSNTARDSQAGADYTYNKNQAIYESAASAHTEVLNKYVDTLLDMINNNMTDQFMEQWILFENAVIESKIFGSSIDTNDPVAVTAKAREYFKKCTGFDPIALIQKSRSGFVNGFFKGATFGLLGQNESQDDVRHQLTNTRKTISERTEEVAGQVLGGAALGTGITLGIGVLAKILSGGKAKIDLSNIITGASTAAIIGGVAGGVTGAIRTGENEQKCEDNYNSIRPSL